MSVVSVSHAEPTLFLTKDQEVQVRAHTIADGSLFFCVSDFIRHMLVEDIGNDDAVRLWKDITECNMNEVCVFCVWWYFVSNVYLSSITCSTIVWCSSLDRIS